MKRMIALTGLLVFASFSISFGNPFSEVPKKHWSYHSIRYLQQTGVIDQLEIAFYPDRRLTRIEMAQLVARGLVHYEKATAMQKVELDKLSLEFKEELESLGVSLESFEEGARVKFNGDIRVRYMNKENEKNKQEIRLRTEVEIGL